MNIYLAGSYTRREELTHYASDCILAGHTIVASWLYGPGDPRDDGRRLNQTPAESFDLAARDLLDIQRAELLIAFTSEPDEGHSRGGRHFEMGFAAAKGLRIWIVGPLENIFCCLPTVRHFTCWPACRCELVQKVEAA